MRYPCAERGVSRGFSERVHAPRVKIDRFLPASFGGSFVSQFFKSSRSRLRDEERGFF